MSVDKLYMRDGAAALSGVHALLQASAHAQRIHVLGASEVHQSAEFVLLWLHHAVRAQQNPALDVAIELAHFLAKPLLVYQGLAGAHRFNSDRHHTFILQGARDAAAQFAARGIRYVLIWRNRQTAKYRKKRSRVRRCARFLKMPLPWLWKIFPRRPFHIGHAP